MDLYTPLLYHWGQRLGLSSHDLADFVQDLLTLLVVRLPEFTYDSRQSFRSWLKTLVVNKWRDRMRRRNAPEPASGLDRLPDGTTDPAEVLCEVEYREYLVGRVLLYVRSEFPPSIWQAFWEVTVEDKPPQQVAGELQLSLNSVYLAKSRVLRRLREELAGLLDS